MNSLFEVQKQLYFAQPRLCETGCELIKRFPCQVFGSCLGDKCPLREVVELKVDDLI